MKGAYQKGPQTERRGQDYPKTGGTLVPAVWMRMI